MSAIYDCVLSSILSASCRAHPSLQQPYDALLFSKDAHITYHYSREEESGSSFPTNQKYWNKGNFFKSKETMASVIVSPIKLTE